MASMASISSNDAQVAVYASRYLKLSNHMMDAGISKTSVEKEKHHFSI